MSTQKARDLLVAKDKEFFLDVFPVLSILMILGNIVISFKMD